MGHQKVEFCEVSHNSLLGCLRYGGKHLKQILISCGCVLLFTNMQFSCKCGVYGVSTWAKFDGRICLVIMQKYILPFLCTVRFVVVYM